MAYTADEPVAAAPMSRALRVTIALAIPFIAALTVVGTYLGKEVIIFAGWVALVMAALLFVRPVIGLAAMTAVYLFSAYPTILQQLGFLTINNLLGACFAVLLTAHVLETRDLSFLRVPQVLLLLVIGVVLLGATTHAESIFPLLQESRGRGRIIDRTSDMAQDYVTRLVFLLFLFVFVRTRSDIRVLFMSFMLALFLAVPSAGWNWITGELNRGFRATASVTAGSNPNRLAMICLMEIACWWFWSMARPGVHRRLLAAGAVAASLFVLVVTGSRSGLLGAFVLAVLLQTGPRRFRASPVQVGGFAGIAVVAVLTVVPAATWERMKNIVPTEDSVGASSTMKREDTLAVGWSMIEDHPWLGVGLGNFREVSRQFYGNRYFRPPHNSLLWAAAEGGVFVLVGYLILFAITWRDLRVVTSLAWRDAELGPIAAALRVIFLLYMFFALFADLWLNPITYVMMGLIVTMRRYLEEARVPAAAAIRLPRRTPTLAVVR